MNTSIEITRGNLLPHFVAFLTNEDGTPIPNLATATLTLVMLSADGVTDIGGMCTLVDAATGEVQYSWVNGQTSVAGTYQGHIHIVYASLEEQDVPTQGALTVTILPKAAAAVTFTCTDQTAAALPGVAVVVMSARGGIAACGVSNAQGIYIAHIGSGAFIANYRKTGVVVPKPQVLQTSESPVAIPVVCEVASAAGAPSVNTCRIFGTIVNGYGRPASTAVHIEVTPRSMAIGGGESVRPQNTGVLHVSQMLKSDSQGYWEYDGVVGAQIQVWVPESGFRKHFIIPNVDSVNVADVRSCKEQEVVWT